MDDFWCGEKRFWDSLATIFYRALSIVVSGSPKRWDRWYIIPQLAVYTTYIPLIVLAEPGGWKMLPIPPFMGTRNNHWLYLYPSPLWVDLVWFVSPKNPVQSAPKKPWKFRTPAGCTSRWVETTGVIWMIFEIISVVSNQFFYINFIQNTAEVKYIFRGSTLRFFGRWENLSQKNSSQTGRYMSPLGLWL